MSLKFTFKSINTVAGSNVIRLNVRQKSVKTAHYETAVHNTAQKQF